MHTVRNTALTSGPSITGSIQPERRADLRAEVNAIVMRVLKENGDAVRRGDMLVHLDDTAIRDALASAEASSRAATGLRPGDTPVRAHEDAAHVRHGFGPGARRCRGPAQRRPERPGAAKARVVLARQQLTRTEVRAPFDGVVSDRKVSAGDTAQIGKELLKVIDPRACASRR
jgi:multidrug resistance efflux pump